LTDDGLHQRFWHLVSLSPRLGGCGAMSLSHCVASFSISRADESGREGDRGHSFEGVSITPPSKVPHHPQSRSATALQRGSASSFGRGDAASVFRPPVILNQGGPSHLYVGTACRCLEGVFDAVSNRLRHPWT